MAPAQIGSYRIEETIAEGGMGVVYKAWDETLGRRVVLKTFRRNLAITVETRERLMREGETLGRLRHPNIVAIFTIDDDGGELFLVMEHVEGKTLDETIAALPDGRMPVDDALLLFEQLLDALDYVHGNGIVHRDLKPANVMVCDGRAKVIDFGIALLAGMPRLTSSATLLGTPAYMSPEQLEAKDVDRRSDIYSAALVLYRMLTGNDPFVAREYLAQIHERLVGPPDPKSVVPDLPAGVCDALTIAMSHDPAGRFRSAAEFRDALRDGAAGFLGVVAATEPEVVPANEEPVPEPVPEAVPVKTSIAPYLYGLCAAGAAYALWLQLNVPSAETGPPVRAKRASLFVQTPPVDPEKLPSIAISAVPVKADPPIAPIVEKAPEKVPQKAPGETETERAARLRRELDALRGEIDALLPPIEADIRTEDYASATHRLDDAGARVQPRATELRQETDEINRLRTLAVKGQADKALWDSRMSDVGAAIDEGRFAEAEGIAKKHLKDPAIPAAIAGQMRQFQQKAHEGVLKSWQGTTYGTTTNAIRKPSSPPRNQPRE
jgi:tRNA A-37 threonylcarbamoyl transferase component Bud32